MYIEKYLNISINYLLTYIKHQAHDFTGNIA